MVTAASNAPKKPPTSKAIITGVARRLWDDYKRPDGALDEPRHKAAVKRTVQADLVFVTIRSGEDQKRLDDDVTDSVRRIRGLSKPTAKEMLARGQSAANAQPVQMWLPMHEFAKEQYEVPITRETKSGIDLLVAEADACAQEYLMRAAELNVKAHRLLAVLAEAKRKGLAAADRLSKVWA